jgi:hypothetical protein
MPIEFFLPNLFSTCLGSFWPATTASTLANQKSEIGAMSSTQNL